MSMESTIEEQLKEIKELYTSRFELMYRDSGNIMHFSFFTIQFFPPTQKISIPKKVSVL